MKESISKDIDKMIRKIIYPSLREYGFTKINGKTVRRWNEDCIWVFGTHIFLILGGSQEKIKMD